MRAGPRWARARTRAIEEELGRKGVDATLIDLLRNGYIAKGSRAEARTAELASDGTIPDGPLSFAELARYSTYFALNPGHVAGEERPRNSKTFPLGIKATSGEVGRMFETYIESKQMENKRKAELRDRARRTLRALEALDARGATALDGLSGPEGLGALDAETELLVMRNKANIEAGLGRLPRETTEVLDFRTVVETYNQGITREEIEAWVWFRRSLGTPMTGWEDYFLKGGESRVMQAVTRERTALRDLDGGFLRSVRAGQAVGKDTGRKRHFNGTPHLVVRDDEGLKLCAQDAVELRFRKGGDADPAEIARLVRSGALCHLDGELLPVPVYAYANMYERLQQLEADRAAIVSQHGEAAFARQKGIVEEHMPLRLSVNNPDPAQRPKILCISEFAEGFKVEALRESTGVVLDGATSLPDAFQEWLLVLDQSYFKVSNAATISQVYCKGRKITDTGLTDEQRRQIKADARNEGEALFERFLHEALAFDDQERLDLHWNRLFNGQSNLPYGRIPVGFEASARFKQFDLEIRPAQREGIAFMNAVGSGIVAYDVGVGKTLTAIVTMADAIHSGKAKRPLVVVPNPTFQKWVAEIAGFTDASGRHVPGILSNTGIKVNEWYNLGKDVMEGIDMTRPVQERTITVVTYEGFKRIGFSQDLMDEMMEELVAVLEQGERGGTVRDQEKANQRYREMLGAGQKASMGDIDTLGFDMLVIDEAHRCKNIFDAVKAGEDGKKRFGMQGAVSDTGLKAFFLCNYIQRRYGRNVMLLTATPFTNSPLEIYSMLSLVAYDAMKRMGILNIHTFFELFVLETTEMAVNYKEEVVAKDVVKRFNNRLVLQKLIYNHIAYKTGEEAGVRRPCKLNLPRVNQLKDGRLVRLDATDQALTYLRMTERQREQQVEITENARKATEGGKPDLGELFRALARSLDNALSPFLIAGSAPPRDCVEFVEGSPKIHYACACIQSVREWHVERGQRVSGQVIYMNRGKQFFPLLKEYLERRVGFAKGLRHDRKTFDEVEIITSEMTQSRKEDVKEAFLEGVVKVIIGTATIREGIDLQKNSTVLYNLYPEWNPTDIRQLEGRIWRQGNRFGYVRVVMPLVQGSMDVFVFQKLEEKTHRINDIWYRGDRGNVLDLESLDPEDVKLALISDVNLIAEARRRVLVREAEVQLAIQRQRLKMLGSFESDLVKLSRARDSVLTLLKNETRGLRYHPYFQKPPTEEELSKMDKVSQRDALAFQKKHKALTAFEAIESPEDAVVLKTAYLLKGKDRYTVNLVMEFKEALARLKRAENAVLKPMGMSVGNLDLESVLSTCRGREAELEGRLDYLKSPGCMEEMYAEAFERKSALAVDGKDVQARVEEFKRYNHLLGILMGANTGGSCQLPQPDNRDERAKKLAFRARAVLVKMRLMELESA